MKNWENIFKVFILIIGIVVIAFNVQLYLFCKNQKVELDSIHDQQQTQEEFNTNKFKYQQDLIEHLSKDLDLAQQQIKDQTDRLSEYQEALRTQKDAILQEAEKTKQVENDSKYIQTSLIDTKAEADAIKQEMKGWQKDYVSILAQLDKKTKQSMYEINALEKNLMALNIPELKRNISSLKEDLEKASHPENNLPVPIPAPEKKIERSEIVSP